ncbi:MAG: RNase adapter RapZ [Elusimicrobiota bacterium]
MEKIIKPEIVILTGLSGAGKSIGIKAIEDFGGFCVDNMPLVLITRFLELIKISDHSKSMVALGLDVRSEGFTGGIFNALDNIEEIGYECNVIFLEASDSVIMRRYSESRRPHPLSSEKCGLKDAIAEERNKLAPLRDRADMIIDTGNISPHELKKKLKVIFFEKGLNSLNINVISFGFKYGVPEAIDMLIDTRFLPNPHYDVYLSEKNGNDMEIKDFVMNSDVSVDFCNKYRELLDFLLPNYINEGKTYLNIGVGCTGGKHRSVVISNIISEYLKKSQYNVTATHRDIAQR